MSEDDLSDEAVQRYYDENQASFFNPEQIVADYILLDLEDFVSVDESVVRDQFEAVKDEYEVAEQARVLHILLIQGDSESDADFADALILCRIDFSARRRLPMWQPSSLMIWVPPVSEENWDSPTAPRFLMNGRRNRESQ